MSFSTEKDKQRENWTKAKVAHPVDHVEVRPESSSSKVPATKKGWDCEHGLGYSWKRFLFKKENEIEHTEASHLGRLGLPFKASFTVWGSSDRFLWKLYELTWPIWVNGRQDGLRILSSFGSWQPCQPGIFRLDHFPTIFSMKVVPCRKLPEEVYWQGLQKRWRRRPPQGWAGGWPRWRTCPGHSQG